MLRDLIASVLEWVTTPWRATFALITLVLVALGFAFWSERNLLIRGLEHWLYAVELDPERAREEAERLLKIADLVVVYEVDVGSNWKRSIYAFDASGEVPGLVGRETSYIPRVLSSELTFETLSGRNVCAPLPEGAYANLLEEGDYSYFCAQKIPHGTGVTVGTIHLLWKTRPDANTEGEARVALMRAADFATTGR